MRSVPHVFRESDCQAGPPPISFAVGRRLSCRGGHLMPEDGIRGIDTYRAVWPPFFTWQDQGALFEITALEVAAGGNVAFAHALLRCGMPEEFEENPEHRLRLTVGLRKEAGRWVVAHEHHSFPFRDMEKSDAEAR